MVGKPTFGNIISLCVYDDTVHTCYILKQKCMPFIQTKAKTLLSSFLCNKAKTPPGYDFFAVHFTAI